MAQPKYPVGIQTFEKIRREGYMYVDKTDYIHKLVSTGEYYFMSRPRRFGKSLLLSTIEAYFSGKRELFKGLALDSLTEDWEPHPILHLDLNSFDYSSEESLRDALGSYLERWENEYGDEKRDRSVEERFSHIIRRAFEKTGRKVVILIDEYDKPMLSAINNEALADRFRSTLKAVYGNLKTMDRYIRFAFLTGAARFSKISIFSDLNNLRDITFDPNYSAICGITNEEIDTYFSHALSCLSERYGLTYDEAGFELKKRYDGYHFAEDLTDVYNPFSLVSVFSSNKFDNYWFASGTPSYLVKILEKRAFELRVISGYMIDPLTLSSTGIMVQDPIITLFQTGYLTITAYDRESDLFTLDYPNQEVKQSFLKFLVPYYTRLTETQTAFEIHRFANAVKEGNPEEFMTRLSSLVARIPYGGKGATPEDHFQNALYLVFTLLGFFTHLEDRTSNGRIDMTVETSEYVYLFEFKVDKSASEVMEQIRRHSYWKGFKSSGKKIYLIAANFSTQTREINDIDIQTA